MDVSELFRQFEMTVTAQAESDGIVKHAGDRGGARESVLREFLSAHLPKKYGVTSGEVVTRAAGTAAEVVLSPSSRTRAQIWLPLVDALRTLLERTPDVVEALGRF